LEYWSEDALKEFFIGTLDFLLAFCQEVITIINHDLKFRAKSWHQRETAKSLKRKTHIFIRKLTTYLQIAPHLNQTRMLAQIYNMILTAEKMGTLPHFGMANQFGDRLHGNPEKQSLRKTEK
jgi:hypothetical protein